MHHIKADSLKAFEQYKLLSGSIIPRAISWITTLNEDGISVNAAPFSFFSGVSNVLPLVSVAILRKNHQMKDTARNLLNHEEAVIHLVTEENLVEMNQTAASLEKNVSEVEAFSLETLPSATIKTPGLKNTAIRFETLLYQYVPIEDREGNIITDLFILEITDFYFRDDVFDEETNYLTLENLAPIGRLSGPYYAGLKQDTIYLKRPK